MNKVKEPAIKKNERAGRLFGNIFNIIRGTPKSNMN